MGKRAQVKPLEEVTDEDMMSREVAASALVVADMKAASGPSLLGAHSGRASCAPALSFLPAHSWTSPGCPPATRSDELVLGPWPPGC